MGQVRRKYIYTAYNFSHFAIYLPKFIKVGGNLTKFWQKQKCTVFLRNGVLRHGIYVWLKKLWIEVDSRTWETQTLIDDHHHALPRQCIGLRPFLNCSELLSTSCCREYFVMISETVQEFHVDKQTHTQTDTPCYAVAARVTPVNQFLLYCYFQWQRQKFLPAEALPGHYNL